MGNCNEQTQYFCCQQGLDQKSQEAPYFSQRSFRSSRKNYQQNRKFSEKPSGLASSHQHHKRKENSVTLLMEDFTFPKELIDSKVRQVRKNQQIANQLFYHGQWLQGVPNGRGVLQVPHKSKYIGFVQKNQPQHFGRFYDYEKQFVYEGQFKSGLFEGKGKLKSIDKTTFDGQFKNGKKLRGQQRYGDGSVYTGFFVNNKKQGKGKYQWPDGSYYIGDFSNGLINGQGQITYSDGRIYKGSFLNQMKHGLGIFKWPDGSYYQGEYFNNLKHGHGKFSWSLDKAYIGPFRQGKQHGTGKMIEQNKVKNVRYQDGALAEQWGERALRPDQQKQ